MTIKLYNTKTKSKEIFEPLDDQNVRMYVCGPTVYDRAHLGNARPVVVFDTLFRLLRHTHGADHVTYVRNFTDVDDKINAKAAETGRSIADITDETISWFHNDMDALGALRPTQEPRATAFIPQMVSMIEVLIERGHAYPDGSGHVLFDVRSYDEYGALARRSLDDMRAGARVEVADNKRDPMDFVLWKPSTTDQPGWDSPWGQGRPGWHIECSAMAYELLGESFDIHGGGIDLAFPHHENEVAQSCCAHPEGDFAKVWMHNEMLQVEGKKMSKSLGNFFTVRDLLEQGVPGEVMRFVFLQTHYSKPMDWSAGKSDAAWRRLAKVSSELKSRTWIKNEYEKDREAFTKKHLPDDILRAISDDLNTSLAITLLIELSSKLEGKARAERSDEEIDDLHRSIRATGQVLGIDFDSFALKDVDTAELLSEIAVKFSDTYNAAKENKDFSQVDKLKEVLLDAGVEVKIDKGSVELLPSAGFDPSKLKALK